MQEVVATVGLALYGFTLLMVLVLRGWLYSFRACSEWNHVRRSLPCSSPKNLFFFFITLFLLCRLAWFGSDGWSPEDISDFILNRVAFALFFTAFTLVIFFWADTLHTMRNIAPVRPSASQSAQSDAAFFKSRSARIAFVAINVLIYAAELMFIIYFLVEASGEREGSRTYDINILIIVALFGLICLAFLVYGIGLLIVTRRAMNTKRKLKFYAQTTVIMVVVVVSFSARFAVFLYRPATGQFLNPWVFSSLAYFVPELVPTVLMATVLSLSLRKQIESRYVIASQYGYSRIGTSRGLRQEMITHVDASSDEDHEDFSIGVCAVSAVDIEIAGSINS